MITPVPTCSGKRGAFIVFEGVDRCGKTTQCALLLKHLVKSLSLAACAMRFPDRTTNIGSVINNYLTSSGSELNDQVVHLLFSANRWESSSKIANALSRGEHVICDRYAYSGVAFTSAKKDFMFDSKDNALDWCQNPDRGLPAPDVVLFLDLDQEVAEKRGGYGEERYEKKEMQLSVRKQFKLLEKIDCSEEGNGSKSTRVPWHIIDASGSISEVETEIRGIVEKTIELVNEGKPLYKLWMDGEFLLPETSTDEEEESNN